VVGHSNTVPDIVEQLGGARPEPIAHDRHGDIWRITRPAARPRSFASKPTARNRARGPRKRRSLPAFGYAP
jgi:hypothetical protein